MLLLLLKEDTLLNKKGDVDTVKNIILVLISLLLLYAVITSGYIPFLSGSGSKQACKNWVNLQSTPLLKEFSSLKSPCLTYEDTIKNVKDEKEIYKKLADNMYECWDTYGQGEADFYKSFDWGSADKYCRICSEIKISSDLTQDKRNIDIDKFEQYLTNEHPPGNRETYAEFFTKADNAKIDFGSGTLNLDPEKRFYTAFVVYKKSTPPDFWTATGSPASAYVKAGGFGAGGCYLGAKAGAIMGAVASWFALGGGAVPGAIVGCAIGFLGGSVTAVAGYANYLFSSVTLFESSSDQIRNACNYIYYKPENFEGKGGSFGGGGAGGSF